MPSAIMNQRIRLLLDATRRDAPARAGVLPFRIDGEKKTWHPLAIRFTGPKSAENAEPNPFRDYRLTVTFARGVKSTHVPGFFAADGAAGESSAEAGDQWEVRFLPDAEGEWAFHAELVRGPDAAIRGETEAEAETQVVGVADGTFRIDSDGQAGARLSRDGAAARREAARTSSSPGPTSRSSKGGRTARRTCSPSPISTPPRPPTATSRTPATGGPATPSGRETGART